MYECDRQTDPHRHRHHMTAKAMLHACIARQKYSYDCSSNITLDSIDQCIRNMWKGKACARDNLGSDHQSDTGQNNGTVQYPVNIVVQTLISAFTMANVAHLHSSHLHPFCIKLHCLISEVPVMLRRDLKPTFWALALQGQNFVLLNSTALCSCYRIRYNRQHVSCKQ